MKYMGDKYCYPNSTVLINKKNIQNAKEFLKAEIHYTAYRLYALQNSEVKGKFDFKHLLLPSLVPLIKRQNSQSDIG